MTKYPSGEKLISAANSGYLLSLILYYTKLSYIWGYVCSPIYMDIIDKIKINMKMRSIISKPKLIIVFDD